MNDAVETEPDDIHDEHPRPQRPLRRTAGAGAWTVALPVGVAGAIIGLVPWLVSGARLPPQVLWATTVRPEAMPFVLLPFSFVTVILIFSLLIVGSAVAGIGGRALRVRGWGLLLLVVGVLIVQILATAQTAGVVHKGLQDRLESNVYLFALVAGTGLSILVGLVVTILVAGAPRAGALIGLTIGAIGMASWIGALIDPTRVGPGSAGGRARDRAVDRPGADRHRDRLDRHRHRGQGHRRALSPWCSSGSRRP